ncbi:MFS transporter [Tistlia consotensis]|nr:MFS transporter [Tistlia consotensis]
MTPRQTAPAPTHAPRDPTVRNVWLLATCQALSMSSQSMLMTITAIVGGSLAGDPKLATLPLAIQFLAMMLSTVPASLIMKHRGRRFGFTLGALFGILGAGLGIEAVYRADFLLLCAAGFCFGVFAAGAMYYRFAAADTASDAFKAKAISLVLAGGVVAGILGPELAKHTRELFAPVMFAGAYASIAVLMLASMAILQLIQIPLPKREAEGGSGRPLTQIAAQPAFLVAVLCGMVGYGAMNLIMVSTPPAMLACDHTFETAAFVIQLHVIGMYGPSFFTGSLIQRFGIHRILAIGALLILACVAINLSGEAVEQFGGALFLLGLGWNFLFVGGSTLLTRTYRPEEKAKVQAANDLCVFTTVAITAFSSGAIHEALGWQALNLAVVVPLLIVLAAVVRLRGHHRRAAAAAE